MANKPIRLCQGGLKDLNRRGYTVGSEWAMDGSGGADMDQLKRLYVFCMGWVCDACMSKYVPSGSCYGPIHYMLKTADFEIVYEFWRGVDLRGDDVEATLYGAFLNGFYQGAANVCGLLGGELA